jgi:hypothetical protein
LGGVYWGTGRNFAFFRGGCGLGWGGGSGGAGGGKAELRTATGVARGFHGFGQNQEQKPHHVGYGGVVLGGNLPRLAIEFGLDGHGDVSDGSHGFGFLRRGEFALLIVCAKGG